RQRRDRGRETRSPRGERHGEDLVEARERARQYERHERYPWTAAERIVWLGLHPEAPGCEQEAPQGGQIGESWQENGKHLADLAGEIDEPLHGSRSLTQSSRDRP